jgi:hypothetical protein
VLGQIMADVVPSALVAGVACDANIKPTLEVDDLPKRDD